MDGAALRLSVVLAASTTLVLIILGLPLAHWLTISRWRWKVLVEAAVALPLVLPPTVLGFYLLLVFSPRGLVGRAYERLFGHPLAFSFEGLLVASVLYGLPFAVQPFTAALGAVDRRLLEASQALGASPLRTFARVSLPLASPGLLAGCVLAFAHVLGEFGVVLMVGGNIPGQTRTLSISLFDAVEAFDYGAAHRTALFLLVLSFAVLVVTYALQRRPRLGVAPTMSAPAVLSVDVERRFPGVAPLRAAFTVPLAPGITVLFGPSGAGKTTVLRAVAGLERPDGGLVRFGEETWFDAARGVDVPARRRRVGLVFQDPALFPHLTVEANLAYGLFRAGREERAGRVAEVARLVGIEALLARSPAALSTGQRQRVSLARALAPRPRLLLLDEPLAALDAPAREELRRELRAVLARSGTPALLVTHDREEALAVGDAMVVLAEGGVRQVGTVEEVFSRPADRVVALAVGTENVFSAEVRAVESGLATVAIGPVLLTALDPGGVAGRVLVCVRAEEVVLEPPGHAATSARNRLPARVTALESRGPMVRVSLDCGFSLVALVTRRSVEEFGLEPGSEVLALVKAPAVRLVPHT